VHALELDWMQEFWSLKQRIPSGEAVALAWYEDEHVQNARLACACPPAQNWASSTQRKADAPAELQPLHKSASQDACVSKHMYSFPCGCACTGICSAVQPQPLMLPP
jgi:hypothetical protein